MRRSLEYMKKVHNLVMANALLKKLKFRSVQHIQLQDDDVMMEVRGLHLLSGLPRTVTIKGPELLKEDVGTAFSNCGSCEAYFGAHAPGISSRYY